MGRGFTQFAFPDSGAPDTLALYSAFLNYKLADDKELHVRQTECWCPVCDFFVMAERIESLSELECELSNLRNPDPAEKDFLAFIYPSIDDAIAEVLARIEWRLMRVAPAKCLHCGSTDIQRIPEGDEFLHPKTGERVLIVGRGWASADPWYAAFTTEGDLIWSDTQEDRTKR